MKIIILGAGEVGFYLAERLSQEGHDISVVETNPRAVDYISSKLDVLTVNDSCVNVEGLKLAGIEKADLVLAVTRIDEINLVASLLAKDFGVANTIARVRNISASENGHRFPYHKLGVDTVIHPEQAASRDIIKLAKTRRNVSEIMEFAYGAFLLVRIEVGKDDWITGKKVLEVSSELKGRSFLVISVIRNNTTYITRGDFVFKEKDRVYFLFKKPEYEELLGKLHIQVEKNKNAMIIGGNEIGLMVAKSLEDDGAQVKLIEENSELCDHCAEELHKSIVLCGDGTDLKLLTSENIKKMDVFIAVTKDDRFNLLASLLAKSIGVKKIICVVRKQDYTPLISDLGIGNVISPRVSVANEILSHVRKGKVLSVTTLTDTNAEIIEQEVTNDCVFTSAPLKNLDIPRDVLVGAVIRGEETFIPTGEDHLRIGDRIIVFTSNRSVKQVEKLFN
jgi:trk system potassium uptake protein